MLTLIKSRFRCLFMRKFVFRFEQLQEQVVYYDALLLQINGSGDQAREYARVCEMLKLPFRDILFLLIYLSVFQFYFHRQIVKTIFSM